MSAADIRFEVTYHWTCRTCRDPEDPNVPGAYGVGDTFTEVQLEASLHEREVHGRRGLHLVSG